MPRSDRPMMPLAITGVGCVSALGHSAEEVLDALESGRSGIEPLPADEMQGCEARLAARVNEFDSTAYLPAMRARRLDRASIFAVAAVQQALRHGDFPDGDERHERLGLVLGTSSAGSVPLTTFLAAAFESSPRDAPPSEFPNTVANAPAGHVSIELGLRGPSTTFTQKQSVVAPALLYSQLMIGSGRCDAVVVGATDEWCEVYQRGYEQLKALRIQNGRASREGIVLAEGAATLLLESEVLIARRSTRPLARLLGVAATSSPGPPHHWVNDPDALARAIDQALHRAALAPADVGSVWLGANGISSLESMEAKAIARIFSDHPLAATGVKGALGEAAVSGAASVALAALARRRGRLPAFAGTPAIEWPPSVRVLKSPSALPAGATLVLTYGAGGTFGAVLLG